MRQIFLLMVLLGWMGSGLAATVVPKPSEFYTGGVGYKVTMTSHYYSLVESPIRTSKSLNVTAYAQLYSLARQGSYEFMWVTEPRLKKSFVGWLHQSRIESRSAATPLNQLLPGLGKVVAKMGGASTPAPSTYSLTVNTQPDSARVRIMNIAPKYYDGIRLAKGSYDIRVDADGYQALSRTINLTSSRVTNFDLKPIRRPTVKTASSSISSSVVVRDDAKGILQPVSRSAIPVGRRTDRTRGIVPPKATLMGEFGYAVKVNKRFPVYKKTRASHTPSIDHIEENQFVIRLDTQSQAPYSYVMYKDKTGRLRYGWIHANLHKMHNAIPFNNLHENYFESFLDGYFRQVRPVATWRLREHRFKIEVWTWRFDDGDPVDVYMQHPSWGKSLVRHSGDKSGTVYRWIDKSQLYAPSQYKAAVASNQKAITELKTITLLFFGSFLLYTGIMLGTEWGRHQLASLSYVLLGDRFRGYTYFACAVSAFFIFLLFSMFRDMNPADFSRGWTEVEYSFYWFMVPLLIVTPIFLYIAKVFLDTVGTKAQLHENSAYTHERSRATRQNKAIYDEINRGDTSMDGIRAKAEITRMELVRDAMKKRKEAYDGFVESAKSQRVAEVEASYRDGNDD